MAREVGAHHFAKHLVSPCVPLYRYSGIDLRSTANKVAHMECAFVQRGSLCQRAATTRVSHRPVSSGCQRSLGMAQVSPRKPQATSRNCPLQVADVMLSQCRCGCCDWAGWAAAAVDQRNTSADAFERLRREQSAVIRSARSMLHMFRHCLPGSRALRSTTWGASRKRPRHTGERDSGRRINSPSSCWGVDAPSPTGASPTKAPTQHWMWAQQPMTST